MISVWVGSRLMRGDRCNLTRAGCNLRNRLVSWRRAAERPSCSKTCGLKAAMIRRIIAALSPQVLEQLGLSAALRQLTSRFRRLHPARVRLHLSPRINRLPTQTEIITYRLVQECFNNIAQHSRATTVNIHLSSTDTSVELRVEDNG